MNKLSFYQQLILKATNCQLSDCEEIEDYMRHTVLHDACLDGLSREKFNTTARTAYKDILWMRTPEGKEYIKKIEKEILI